MNRRRFRLSLAGGGAALVAPASAQDPPPVAHVDYEDVGRTIASDFIGLSYESAVVAANDFFTADNRTLLRLLRTLGSEGVLRIGGNTSERTLWRTQDTAAPRENFVITPSAIDRLAGFLRALGWRLIYGLNLAAGTPEDAAAEAAYVARGRSAASSPSRSAMSRMASASGLGCGRRRTTCPHSSANGGAFMQQSGQRCQAPASPALMLRPRRSRLRRDGEVPVPPRK
jgi:hypothetical protein